MKDMAPAERADLVRESRELVDQILAEIVSEKNAATVLASLRAHLDALRDLARVGGSP